MTKKTKRQPKISKSSKKALDDAVIKYADALKRLAQK